MKTRKERLWIEFHLLEKIKTKIMLKLVWKLEANSERGKGISIVIDNSVAIKNLIEIYESIVRNQAKVLKLMQKLDKKKVIEFEVKYDLASKFYHKGRQSLGREI